MQRFEHEQESFNHAWRSEGATPEQQVAMEPWITVEEEDARRRFLLSIRAMTVRKQQQEREAAAINQWMAELEADVRAQRASKKKQRLFRITVLGVGFVVVLNRGGHFINGWPANWWVPLVLYWMLYRSKLSRGGRTSDMAGRLATARDPRAVSVLATAARDGDSETRQSAIRGLKSILPQLTASDASHITGAGMEALLQLMLRVDDVPLQIAILKGLEQVGNESALPQIAILEQTADEKELLDAIRSCREFLKVRAKQSLMRQTLLRATSDSPSESGRLLRPAGMSETPAEQLLRPAE